MPIDPAPLAPPAASRMPELPEITAYREALERYVVGHVLERVRVRSPSLLRTWDPPLTEAHGRRVAEVRRIGKRLVLGMAAEADDAGDRLFLVLHLMVTGRLRWKATRAAVPKKGGLAAFDFPHGSLLLTELGTKKKASLHAVRGEDALVAHDPGGIEPLDASAEAFREALVRQNRTLKRALTDPRAFSGIGNAHSDEILLRARLSPVQRTRNLSREDIERLREATVHELTRFADILREEVGRGFPERITAFHPAMAAHGRYGEPCPQCGAPIQRIVYASTETNYCAVCQTGGRLLADRALSRILREEWPRTLEEWEGLEEG